MATELTNLLPQERKNALKRDYAFRLGTGVCVLFGFLLIAHGALLASSYAYVGEQQKREEARLAELSERREVSGFTDISERITAFDARANSLKELETTPSASDHIRSILEVPRTDIRIHSFTFSAPQQKNPGSMQVSGTAETREALRAFNQRLGGLSFVKNTDLPLSAYAKERDIPFQIQLVLTPVTP